VDVMTDVSMPMTEFTRYTVAPTSVSRASSKFVFEIRFVTLQLKVHLDGARDQNESWKEK
jgi:elongator complex protein 1